MGVLRTDFRLWALFTVCGAVPLAAAALAEDRAGPFRRRLAAALTLSARPAEVKALAADVAPVALPLLALTWVAQARAVRSGVRFPDRQPEQADDYGDPPAG